MLAGGLGLAAVQLASAAGAVVVGTAGGPPKRSFLRGLGVGSAVSSRDTQFATELPAAGGGAVEVVLNSLTSPGLHPQLQRRNGWIVPAARSGLYLLLGQLSCATFCAVGVRPVGRCT